MPARTRRDRMWIREARYMLRQLRRSPAFSATVVVTISLAMAANTLVFSVVQAALLRKLPYRDEQRLVVAAPLAPGVVLDWQSRSRSFSSLAAFMVWDYDVLGFDRPERVSAAVVTGNFFEAL